MSAGRTILSLIVRPKIYYHIWLSLQVRYNLKFWLYSLQIKRISVFNIYVRHAVSFDIKSLGKHKKENLPAKLPQPEDGDRFCWLHKNSWWVYYCRFCWSIQGADGGTSTATGAVQSRRMPPYTTAVQLTTADELETPETTLEVGADDRTVTSDHQTLSSALDPATAWSLRP